MKFLCKLLPWLFVALFGTEIIAVMLPRKDGEYHVREFGRLPVLLNGRIQPFDSVARNSLLQIRSTGDVPLEEVPSWQFWHHPKKLKSTEWLLEVMARPETADTRPIFLIHHAELLGELKLQDKGVEKSGLRYYTFNELQPLLPEINEQARKAGEVKSDEQTSFQKQVSKLANALSLYQRLKVTLQPEGAEDFARQLAEFQKNLGPAHAAAEASESGKPFDRQALQRIAGPLQEFQLMARFGYPLTVPPLKPHESPGSWQTMGASLLESGHSTTLHPAVMSLAAMSTAYRQQKPDSFNHAVAGYREWLAPHFQKALRKGRAEFYFNNVKPFLHAMIIYLCAFVLACGALLTLTAAPNLSESLRRSAFYLVILAGLVHTFGLVFRMALEGRPPVTNLYSSAIFIGWGTMVLGLMLEKVYRVAIGSLVASLAGFITLTIAHNLALGGDTMEMLRAVLDTNFWLATHVIIITLGYASTFAAGLLAILYIFLGVFTPLLTQRIGAGAQMSPSAAPGQTATGDPTPFPSATALSGDIPLSPAGKSRGEGERPRRPIANRRSKIANHLGPGVVHYGLCHCLLRHPVQLCRHRPGRHLGRPILGPVLGLGPEGERCAAHRDLERDHPPRPLGQPARRPRDHEPRRLRQHCHELLVVRREHARHWPALLRVHGCRLQVVDDLHRQPGFYHRRRPVATRPLAQLPHRRQDPAPLLARPRQRNVERVFR